MAKIKQETFCFHTKTRTEHGGEIRKGKRKEARPFDATKAMHVVLRSTNAKGNQSFLSKKNQKFIKTTIYAAANRFDVKVLGLTNVGNHLHIIIKTTSNRYRLGRLQLANYLRYITGRIAFFVTGAKKGCPAPKFWNALAYTRIIQWGRELGALQKYLLKNFLESKNIWNRKSDPEEKWFLSSLKGAGIYIPWMR